ncbi:MAG: calcium-binding protein, partial [Sphingomonadaceae bacterium]
MSFGLRGLSQKETEEELLSHTMVVENWETGDLGIEFFIWGGKDETSLFSALWQYVTEFAAGVGRFAKNLLWLPSDDPLVLDLNGDGLVSRGVGATYWDNDGDLFGEKSGWLSGEDGFLVHDANGDRSITADELFGGPGLSGYDELSEWDSNGDGIVNADDLNFTDLQIWRDANENGVTDAGELHQLAAFGITAFSLNAHATNITTANGTIIRAESFYARADGTTGALGELIFETERGTTRYLGDDRVAAFAPAGVSGEALDAHGYGVTTDLAVAASNDLALAELLADTAAAMTVADLDTLRDQARAVLGSWARAHADSRELGAALVSADGALLDHAVYTEDASGGFWMLASGADVRDAGGAVIARATLEQVLTQTGADGASWQLVQGWTPSDRDFTPENRLETAYLISTGASATVLDFAIRQSDAQGDYWTLASGADVLAADGSVIARASLADIMAQASDEGSEWRMEDFAAPDPAAPFDRAAFYIRDGIVTDYTVWIEDADGVFAVWASNLQRALDAQEAYGPGSFGLRGFALDLDNLPDADNSDDSAVRVEIMTLDEVHYAFASAGEQFRPELFVAQSAADNTLTYDYSIAENREFAGTLVNSYLAIGRAMAVRIASQGGLADYFEGVDYDASTDTFLATSGRELIPLFTAILADAPVGDQATVDYLREWDRVLQTVYPDFKRHGHGPRSQAFLMQMIVAGFENSPVDASFLQVAEALSIDEERVLQANGTNPDLEGTRGDDLIYIGSGSTIARGGLGSDVYIIGRDFGEVTIQDVEPILQPGASFDYLRFAHLTPEDVYVTKDGADLVIEEIGTGNILRIRNQFEGRWPGIFGGDYSDNTEIVEIVFADGTVWDFVDMAFAASHPLDSNDVVLGTEAIDVLDGGAGNDVLRGGGDGDLYIFGYGYGKDRIVDAENNPFRDGIDLVSFGEGITAERLSFERVGASNDLIIHLLDENGARTGDILTIEGQFFQQDAFITTLKPNLIELLVFDDGSFLDEQAIRERVLAEARTDGEDAIWAFDEAETLDGGAGDDLLVGQDGADTYVFARGYGNDVIQDRSFEVGIGVTETENTLRLEGINASDIEVLREAGSPTVSLRIRDTGETVTLKNEFRVTYAFWTIWEDNVDFIQFADGTVWDQDRLGREVLTLERTDGDDHIIGFDWSDILDGGAGNDRLVGGLYNDTYVFRAGYGHDTIFDSAVGRHPLLPAGYDTLDLQGIELTGVDFSRAGTNLTLTLRATGESVTLEGQYDRLGDTVIEDISFNGFHVDWQDLGADDIDLIGTSGDDVLVGTHYAETIDGRGGNDLLIGSSDGDTYLFDIGYGHDVIDDTIDDGRWRAGDTVRFGADVVSGDVRFTKEGDDLLITFVGFTDSLRVLNQFGSVLAGVERFEFADGTSLAIEDVEELLQIAGGTRGDNILTGFDDRANILDGRQGDDQLLGGSFGDTYLFGVGYGFDTITEKLDSASVQGATDRVVFGRLVDPDDVIFRADGLNLVVTIPSSGEQLTIVEGLGARQIEEFNFYDGTIWGQAEIRAALLRGTDGNDLLFGFDDSDDVLAGGQGSDLLIGKAGNDVYRFGVGDGLDAIEDSAGIDRIELGEGISADMVRFEQVDDGLLIRIEGFTDSLLVRGGLDDATKIESIVLADGYSFGFEDVRSALIASQRTDNDDIITGFAERNDIIEGGSGNDELKGLTGDDVYIIGENPGLDIV